MRCGVQLCVFFIVYALCDLFNSVNILILFQTADNQWKMAKRRITQETFDAAVRENMEEFEMAAEEALKEAVEQFESQGNTSKEENTIHTCAFGTKG